MEQGRAEGAQVWQPSWQVPKGGSYYPPTLCTDVFPSSTIAQVEIFGPVLVSMTFRTPEEAVALANNTPFGLAASVWSENINLALDVAPKIKAGVVWVNASNLFDAASGFGGRPNRSAAAFKQWSMSSGRSPRRSRSGGSTIGTTLSR